MHVICAVYIYSQITYFFKFLHLPSIQDVVIACVSLKFQNNHMFLLYFIDMILEKYRCKYLPPYSEIFLDLAPVPTFCRFDFSLSARGVNSYFVFLSSPIVLLDSMNSSMVIFIAILFLKFPKIVILSVHKFVLHLRSITFYFCFSPTTFTMRIRGPY